MLSLVEDRLTQLEAQRGVGAYRGRNLSVLDRMDALLYGDLNQAEVLTNNHRVLKIPEREFSRKRKRCSNSVNAFHIIYFTECHISPTEGAIQLEDCYYKYSCPPCEVKSSVERGMTCVLTALENVILEDAPRDVGGQYTWKLKILSKRKYIYIHYHDFESLSFDPAPWYVEKQGRELRLASEQCTEITPENKETLLKKLKYRTLILTTTASETRNIRYTRAYFINDTSIGLVQSYIDAVDSEGLEYDKPFSFNQVVIKRFNSYLCALPTGYNISDFINTSFEDLIREIPNERWCRYIHMSNLNYHLLYDTITTDGVINLSLITGSQVEMRVCTDRIEVEIEGITPLSNESSGFFTIGELLEIQNVKDGFIDQETRFKREGFETNTDILVSLRRAFTDD